MLNRYWKIHFFIALIVLAMCAGASAAIAGEFESDPVPWDSVAGKQDRAQWWKAFGDEKLNGMVKRSLTGNHDVLAAIHRIDQSTAVTRQARSPLMPRLSLTAKGLMGPFDSLGFQQGGIPTGGLPAPDLYYSGSAALNLRYRLDAWAKEYLAYRASRLNEKASREERDTLAVIVAGQTLEAYFDAVAALEQIRIIEKQIQTSEKLAELIFLRYQRGEANSLAVLQQRQQLSATRSNLPQARAFYRISLNRLSVLSGAEASSGKLSLAQSLPELPERPELGKRDSLLKNRPDLRASQAHRDAAREQARSAGWVHFPGIELSANGGYQAFKSISEKGQFYWDVGLFFTLPLFSGLGEVSAVEAAEAGARAAGESHRQLLLQAESEVESAWIQENEVAEQLKHIQEQYGAAKQSFEESKRQYLAGLVRYLDVLTSLNNMQLSELSMVQANRSMISARIKLHQALGGSLR